MLKKEWVGKKDFLEKRMKKVGLDTKGSKQKNAMRGIIKCRYIEMMGVDETMTRVMFDYGADLSYSQYYRLLNKAIELLEDKRKTKRKRKKSERKTKTISR